jgi:hypothetical protein
MKIVLTKLAALFIIIWFSLWGLSKLYDFSLLQNCNLKTSYIQKKKIDAAILIQGPCQTLWMVQPALIKKKTELKTYNLGLTHADFADNYLHLYLYLKHNKAPKFLFIHVSLESMDMNYNMFISYRFSPFIGDAVIDSVVKEFDSNYFKWVSIPFMKYAYYNNAINFDVIQGLKHYFTNRTSPYFADGFEPPFSLNKEINPEKFTQIYVLGYSFAWDGLREKYLRKTIQLAQQYKINVYLYESPILKEALTNVRNRSEIITKIKNIAGEYRIKFVQFENMKIADSVKYFISSVSMTKKGSEIFSDSLGNYIKNEIIKQ